MLGFPLEEIKDRLAAARRLLAGAGVEALLIESRPNTFYFSGFTGTTSFLLIGPRFATFITDFRYAERVRDEVQGFKILIPAKPPIETLGDIVRKKKISSLGFEGSLTFDVFNELKKELRPCRLKRVDIPSRLRRTKSPLEEDRLRAAQRLAERAFVRLLGEIAPGMTERQVAARLLHLFEEEGAEGPSFPPIVASGPHSASPHATPTDRKIARRDIVTIDMGVILDGYCSDMTRTFFFGKPSSEMVEVYEAVWESQARALATIRAGVTGFDADAAARDYLKERGYGKYFGHGTGHGVGVEIHEEPRVSFRSKDTLQAGDCVSVEPGVYLSGKFGVRIEDVVIVGKDGCENLMKAKKELLVL